MNPQGLMIFPASNVTAGKGMSCIFPVSNMVIIGLALDSSQNLNELYLSDFIVGKDRWVLLNHNRGQP